MYNATFHTSQFDISFQGPVSVAVFTLQSELNSTLQRILELRRRYKVIRQYVTFSFVRPYTVDHQAHNSHINLFDQRSLTITSPLHVDDFQKNNSVGGKNNSGKFLFLLSSVNRMNMPKVKFNNEKVNFHLNYGIKGHVPYPNNLLRNVALNASFSMYVLPLDIDMMPSEGLLASFLKFHELPEIKTASLGKTAFVLPIYENDPSYPIPSHKADLLRSIQRKSARPFYGKLCPKCQVRLIRLIYSNVI